MSTQTNVDRPAPFVFDRTGVEQYLAFGFNPDVDDPDPLAVLSEWSRNPRGDLAGMSERALVREGTRALRAAVAQCVEGTATIGGDQVVFLSGGLDSRTILGALLEIFDTSQIIAVTFGMPGEQDFDDAACVAKAAGVRHETLQTAGVEWTTQGLVDSILARRLPLPFPFGQRYVSYLLHERLGPQNVFWDGLCGDIVSGKLFRPGCEAWDWGTSVADFLAKHLAVGRDRLYSAQFDPGTSIQAEPFCSTDDLACYYQLMYGIRQRHYVSTRVLRDYPTCTPFLAGPWLDVMLRIPVRHRLGQRLYEEIQKAAFPRLFALPTTAHDGGAVLESRLARSARNLRWRVEHESARRSLTLLAGTSHEPGANAAIRAGLRCSGGARELAVENLTDLAARGIIDWVDVESYIPGIAAEQASDAALTRLLGLELNLKAAEQVAATTVPESPVDP
ncbi:asparagine synthase-related protein [Pengzhenrongella phosphoraccumulans]|uniref:asparagine synthase-related protein n=1 Tax=Pengzhenrongella phosphoraccumulans TaxID=3114394 RepID=UPI0038901B13